MGTSSRYGAAAAPTQARARGRQRAAANLRGSERGALNKAPAPGRARSSELLASHDGRAAGCYAVTRVVRLRLAHVGSAVAVRPWGCWHSTQHPGHHAGRAPAALACLQWRTQWFRTRWRQPAPAGRRSPEPTAAHAVSAAAAAAAAATTTRSSRATNDAAAPAAPDVRSAGRVNVVCFPAAATTMGRLDAQRPRRAPVV